MGIAKVRRGRASIKRLGTGWGAWYGLVSRGKSTPSAPSKGMVWRPLGRTLERTRRLWPFRRRTRKIPREKLSYLLRDWTYSAAHVAAVGLVAFLSPVAWLMWWLCCVEARVGRWATGRAVEVPRLREGIPLVEWP